MKRIYFLISIIALCLQLNADGQLISGKVISERGYKAAGIQVKFKNKSNTIITNADGSFKIMAASLPDRLTFSAEGYEPYSVMVTDKTVLDPEFEIVLLEQRGKLKREDTRSVASSSKISIRGMSSVSSAAVEKMDIPESTGVAYERAAPAPYPALRDGYTMSVPARNRVIYSAGTTVPGREPARSSQMLSAGEVNDFKKWEMWQDYTANEFKALSEQWKLFAINRYSLQLQNNEHGAATGREVYLINQVTKDTAWKAVTDNTGKAEMWGGFNRKDSGEYSISVKDGGDVPSASTFANGINKKHLNTGCNASDKVEIAFVVDATGSMQDEIDYLKLELEDVLRKTFEKNSTLNLNAGAVFYRDKGDEYITKHLDFKTDLLKVLNFIKLQRADGGGDYPEAVNAALHTAIDSMSWSADARSKILFLIMDAPPHNEAAADMYNLVAKAAAKGIRIVPIACSGTDKSTEFIMRSMALATNGTYIFLTDDSGIGNSHIKPTTDAFDVELLNTLLQRTIEQMIYVRPCSTVAAPEPYKPFINADSIKLYPNPTQGSVTIESIKPLKEIYVTDFTGKILMRIHVQEKSNRYKINLKDYPSATYFIRYVTSDNRWGAEKVELIN